MSKKRKREPTDFDADLVKVWDLLSHDHEDVRLEGAGQLVSKAFDTKYATADRLKMIMHRLFRGLCSSRKSARLGFSIALTEVLSQLKVYRDQGSDMTFSGSELVNLLESQTSLKKASGRQDERDHYFGRLFGVEALIQSRYIFEKDNPSHFLRLVDLLCAVAVEKPWLRQECGWVLYQSVQHIREADRAEELAAGMMEKLRSYSLIRTPEGVALWLAIRDLLPNVGLPKHVWSHDDPLTMKGVNVLAQVMKDAKTQIDSDTEDIGSQGAAGWSPQLHFAWEVVDEHLGRDKVSESPRERIGFSLFWTKVVEESLFSASSSTERKHWGLLLLGRYFTKATSSDLDTLFTPNAIQCLIHAFKGDDKYLRKSAQKAVQSLEQRLNRSPQVKCRCLQPLLDSSGGIDLDQVTKSSVIGKVLEPTGDGDNDTAVFDQLRDRLERLDNLSSTGSLKEYNVTLKLLTRLFDLHLARLPQEEEPNQPASVSGYGILTQILNLWISKIFFKDSGRGAETQTEQKFRDLKWSKFSSCLEQSLKRGWFGRRLLREAVLHIEYLEKHSTSLPNLVRRVDFEPDIEQLVKKAWKKLTNVTNATEFPQQTTSEKRKSKEAPVPSPQAPGSNVNDGMAMLYALTLLQVYNGETEAAEVLRDVLYYQERHEEQNQTIKESHAEVDDSQTMVEILLSIVSQPSKLMRRLALQIFESFAPLMSGNGLQSLIRVLESKESLTGQEEMFEDANDEVFGEEMEGADNSDIEMVSDDHEIANNGEKSPSTSSSSSEPEPEDDDEKDEDEAEDDPDLADFESKLAAALGTRRLVEEDLVDLSTSDSSSDSSMTSSQMMALDTHLSSVFQARKQQSATQRSHLQRRRDARNNVVNFKNRVLDLVSSYLRLQSQNPLSLGLLLPLLHLARTTGSKQLSDRACSILRDHCTRCRSTTTTAAVRPGHSPDPDRTLSLLESVHAEACRGGGGANHATAASSLSLLLVKILLVHHHQHSFDRARTVVADIVAVYARTRERQLTDPACGIQPQFFTDWNNWCAQWQRRRDGGDKGQQGGGGGRGENKRRKGKKNKQKRGGNK